MSMLQANTVQNTLQLLMALPGLCHTKQLTRKGDFCCVDCKYAAQTCEIKIFAFFIYSLATNTGLVFACRRRVFHFCLSNFNA
jgi:hypothetical protein